MRAQVGHINLTKDYLVAWIMDNGYELINHTNPSAYIIKSFGPRSIPLLWECYQFQSHSEIDDDTID